MEIGLQRDPRGQAAPHAQTLRGDEAVNAISELLSRARLDSEDILDTVTSALSEVRQGTWVAALINKDPRTVRVVAANDSDSKIADYVRSLQISGRVVTAPISMGVIGTGEPILIPNVPFEEFIGSLSGDIREYLAKNPPPISPILRLGILVTPIRARGAILGMLGLFERAGSDPPTEMDIGWVQAIADRTGLAVENAELNLDAIHRLERLNALRRLGLAISCSPDLRLTLHVVLDEAIDGLGVDAADILRLNESSGLFEVASSTGFLATSMPDYHLRVDEVLPGQHLAGRRIDPITAPRALAQTQRRSLFAREGFNAYGAVPLMARGKLLGALEVFHRSQLRPDQEWLDFLDALGNSAATAIDYAAMFACLLRVEAEESTGHANSPVPDFARLDMEILGYVVEGLTNRVIAEKVHLSLHTVKFHIRRMLKKVGVSNRTELARKATQEGWL
jgi:DNA-binding CsgD family transcriptional regulator/GAF domain-containing protein